jgi:hypothetical protein
LGLPNHEKDKGVKIKIKSELEKNCKILGISNLNEPVFRMF